MIALSDSERLRRARHGATDVANAERIRRVLTQRGTKLADESLAAVLRVAAQLPSIIRAESQVASAAANELGVHEMRHHGHAERARTLDLWARECTTPERQKAALRVLARREQQKDDMTTEGDAA